MRPRRIDYVGKALWNILVSPLASVAGDAQFGALPGRGTAQPSVAMGFVIQMAHAEKRTIGLLFTDVKSAFYTALPEVVLGALLQPCERSSLLTGLGFTPTEIADFEASHLAGVPLVEQAGVNAA